MSIKRFDNVWEALESDPSDAVNMTLRSELLMSIQNTVASWDVKQEDAAARMGISQPMLNDLLRGRIDNFSLDALVSLASQAGLLVELRAILPAA